jgi:hypothetical protein
MRLAAVTSLAALALGAPVPMRPEPPPGRHAVAGAGLRAAPPENPSPDSLPMWLVPVGVLALVIVIALGRRRA